MVDKYLIVIVGPTGVGKTAFAIALASVLQTEIVCADARQCYKGMNIGTAKPTADEMKAVTHHLVDFVPLDTNYNVTLFEKDAIETINKLFKTKKYIIMCGGTGLYIDAVCKGIDYIPDVKESIRDKLYSDLEKLGIDSLKKELYKRDPDYFKIVDLNNPRRIIRALEVCIGTGMPYSSFIKGRDITRPFNTITLGLDIERADLYKRINERVDKMLALGLVKEVESLYKYKHNILLNTIGYTEIIQYLDGNGSPSLEEAINLIKKNSRNYAKRQLTWFRKNNDIFWLDNKDLTKALHIIDKYSKVDESI
jgi:tRNA dimethylallyltransferase